MSDLSESCHWLGYCCLVETFKGTTGHPELTFIAGQELRVAHHTVIAEADMDFRALELAQLKGVILAIDWVHDNKHHVWGSAVMVAPGVAITATHVIRSMQAGGFLAEEGGYLLALGFQDDRVVFWNPDSFTPIGTGDLAILTLVRAHGNVSHPPEPIQVNAATIAARAPDTGEKISLFGFAASNIYFQSGSPVGLSHFGSVGSVSDLYPERRDQLLACPSACVAAKTLRGMSGGGAFDAQGRLIGIVSTGIKDQPTFISLVWPCLFTPLELKWPPGLVTVPATLRDLALVGLSKVEHLEDVRAHVGHDGTPLVSLESRSTLNC